MEVHWVENLGEVSLLQSLTGDGLVVFILKIVMRLGTLRGSARMGSDWGTLPFPLSQLLS